MRSSVHFYCAGIQGGAVYLLSQSVEISIVTFLSGVFIDIDHIFDFLIFSGEKFSIKNLFSWCNDWRWEKVSLIFHSYELYLILGIIAYYFPNNILTGLLYGIGLHLILDQIGNCNNGTGFRLFPCFYFLTYRIYVGFHKDKLRIAS